MIRLIRKPDRLDDEKAETQPVMRNMPQVSLDEKETERMRGAASGKRVVHMGYSLDD